MMIIRRNTSREPLSATEQRSHPLSSHGTNRQSRSENEKIEDGGRKSIIVRSSSNDRNRTWCVLGGEGHTEYTFKHLWIQKRDTELQWNPA